MPTENVSISTSKPWNVFVTDDNIYYGYEWNSTNGIRKLTSNHISVLETCLYCYDIFVDIYNNIYCSLNSGHQVIRKSLNNGSDRVQVVAGTGYAGSTSYTLDGAGGIFVDTNSDLYVADHFNSRVQLFPSGQLEGITVVGSGSYSPTITLNRPTGVILDANKYLFVVDYMNDRIVGDGLFGFRCLVGCNGSGPGSDQLQRPRSMSFDSFGNMFVADELNHRIQKFTLMFNSCSRSTLDKKIRFYMVYF